MGRDAHATRWVVAVVAESARGVGFCEDGGISAIPASRSGVRWFQAMFHAFSMFHRGATAVTFLDRSAFPIALPFPMRGICHKGAVVSRGNCGIFSRERVVEPEKLPRSTGGAGMDIYLPMWLSIDTRLQYRFDDAIDPVAFFEHLPLLLAPTDTLVLGCYDARPDIRQFLAAEAHPPGWHRFGVMESWEVNRKEHPDGAAFHLRAEARILQQLIQFVGSVAHHVDLCDHIAGYSAEHPLLIYHGTFWEPLFVSTRIPRDRVEAFSKGVGVPFVEIDFEKEYSFTSWKR